MVALSDPKNDMKSPLQAQALSAGYAGRAILPHIDVAIERGQITVLVGPNGSGKSTLLRVLARLLSPTAGVVLLDGKPIAHLPTREVARQLAILPQLPQAAEGITVATLIEQGRFPHVGPLGLLRPVDRAAVAEAMALTDTAQFAVRPVDTLSGGERQRVWIALALAQATPLLLLDEPTTFLDIGHQLEILELITRLNRERNLTVVMVLHDINQAARYAHRLIVLHHGRIVADGEPRAIITPELLARVFGVRVHIIADPHTGAPVCIPYASLATSQVAVQYNSNIES